MEKLFEYRYIDNKATRTLFLLHGTGGDENDFLFLDETLKKTYNLVGLRGKVDEQGMNRFFRRLSFGVFDKENIKEESEKLKTFIQQWQKDHNIQKEDAVFLGYSNGANMLLATLFYYPELFTKLLLLHPMLPFQPQKTLDLTQHTIYVSYGVHDTMVSKEESKRVIETLSSQGAKPIAHEYPSGHEITDTELKDIVLFLT